MRKLLLINLLLFTSCYIKKAEVIILNCSPSLIEIYNGKKLLLKDSLINTNLDDVSKAFTTQYNFSDSIYVNKITFNGLFRTKKLKLSKNKYIYIKCDGGLLRVFGTNSRRRSI